METQPQDHDTEKRERNTFIFLSVILGPVLAIAIVGGYGFMIWMGQLIFGPPGI
jgi:nitrate reductase NapE